MESYCKLRKVQQIEDGTGGTPEKLFDYVVTQFDQRIPKGSRVIVKLVRDSGAVVIVDADLQGLSLRELFKSSKKLLVEVQ